MPADQVVLERHGDVALVTLNRPEKMNAVTWAMIQRADEIIAEVKADATLRAVALTGEGRALSAGTDLRELSTRRPSPAIRFGTSHFAGAASRDWTSIGKPAIAAVNGAAAGLRGGVAAFLEEREPRRAARREQEPSS